MQSPCDRRTALRIVGPALAGAFAGCVADRGSDKSNPSPSQPSTPTQAQLTTAEFTFDIGVDAQFTDTHPARIHTALTNTAATPLTLVTGVTPPFTSYLSDGKPDTNRLILIPNGPDAAHDPIEWMGETDPLPMTAEDGCWNITQGVIFEQLGSSTTLDPGETTRQQFAVYGYQNDPCLPPGTYRFVDNATIHRGRPSSESPAFEVTLEFTLTRTNDQSLSVTGSGTTVSKHEQ
ncbi:hypothetical protein [Natrinema hispanicum]|uniref:Uncharacterized protein n=1 Tax=Natrinema hispanicum TaxID=392421 RepID=A0A1G6MXP9_9EURY|nr:hypothetical protein [Natrinema hispanicum]SDC60221.1 hypothetical protein SAMN05192552_1005144 [Natrinema hispanicum]SET80776.1 hypothetical protein SAMN04488694_11336 [Natrinema hispanicum]